MLSYLLDPVTSSLNGTYLQSVWSKPRLVVYNGKLAFFLPGVGFTVFLNSPDLTFLPLLVTCLTLSVF